jgi:uncharacterized protein (DUF58 family)
LIFATHKLVVLGCAAALMSLSSLVLPAMTPLGWAALLLCLALAAIDLQLSRGMSTPALARELPTRARVQEPRRVLYRLQSKSPWPQHVALLDEWPPQLGGDQRLGSFELEASGELELDRVLTPLQRGAWSLGVTHVTVGSRLGFFVRRFTLDLGQSLPVHPADTMPRKDGLDPASAAEPGLRPRRPRGSGSEFAALRQYTPGDEPRRIDWKASARAGQLVVTEFRAERSTTLLIAVDCGRLMGTRIEGQSKLDHALSAAVSLVRAAGQGDDRIGFLAFHRELCAFVPPQRGQRALGSLLEAAIGLQPAPAESSYRVLVETLQKKQKKRALIVLLTDFVESDGGSELEAYIAALARRHRVLLVGLRDRLLRELEQPNPRLDRRELFRRLVLQDLDVSRETALLRLQRLGVQALDLDPAHITLPLLNRYLQIRREEWL